MSFIEKSFHGITGNHASCNLVNAPRSHGKLERFVFHVSVAQIIALRYHVQ